MDIPTIIILITLFIIFMIFLVFDLFGRNEKYGYLAYPVAVIPVNFYWAMGGDSLFAYIILFLLWIATILRDTIGVYRKKEKEINEILMYLTLAVLIQLIISAIIPVNNPALQNPYTEQFWFFWLPNVHSAIFDPAIATTFRLVATILIFLIIVPLILDIKDEEVPLPIIIIFVVIFIIPFLYLSYVWIPDPAGFWTLTFLFSVILFVILLLITRSGMETK
ncbi:MAG: hypothetical protein JSV62_15160 [Promethearchaeota archaeon]|nr:MAG: hypothetical protein JSV62_15160 [Candidatus Lokiarchaeota archaeon]